MFSKKSIIFFASTLTLVSLASARIEYNESTSVASDISDSWIVVDYPKSGGNMSSTRGNIVVRVENNVSVTAYYLNAYGTNSSLVFLGNNQVNAGSISIFGGAGQTGASMEFYNSTINATSINLREGNSSLLLKDSQTTVSGKLNINSGANVSLANGISLENTSFELVIDDISTLQDKQLNEYFETITLAGNSIENLLTSGNLTVLDKESGILFDVSISDSGIITLVPEPSTYAAIFGALALAFAAYRRRK